MATVIVNVEELRLALSTWWTDEQDQPRQDAIVHLRSIVGNETEHNKEVRYREALYSALRALMHSMKWVKCDNPKTQLDVDDLITKAFNDVANILDEGRDEKNEQTA